MIDAIAMTEVIPFRLQENSGRAGHSLGAIQPFSVAASPQRGELLVGGAGIEPATHRISHSSGVRGLSDML